MAFKPKTYLELCMAMKTRATVEISGKKGVINGITAEDGSGFSWNVTIQPNETMTDGLAEPYTVFFRE